MRGSTPILPWVRILLRDDPWFPKVTYVCPGSPMHFKQSMRDFF